MTRARFLILGAAVLSVSCDAATLASPPPADPILREARTDADSALVRSSLSEGTTAAAVQSDPMVLESDIEGFTITLENRECASPTNTVSVVSPVTGLLSTTMCQEPIGTPWSFSGPFTAGSAIVLDFQSGVSGATGAMIVTGAFPEWTVTFEDGFDADFNDFVLSVVAVTEPGLDCTSPVPRGDDVVCRVTGATSVSEWRFRGSGGVRITDPSTQAVWQGEAALGGRVEVDATVNGQPETFRAEFDVDDRSWTWGAGAGGCVATTTSECWTFADLGAPSNFSGANAEPIYGGVNLLGWNCSLPDCISRRVRPDLALTPTQGWTPREVPSGPNVGLWYVSDVSFFMDRASNINAQVQQGGNTRTLPAGSSQEAECRAALQIPVGTPVDVNFYTFNSDCKGEDIDAMILGIQHHEAFGSNGDNGHESVGRAEATRKNIYQEIEEYVFETLADLQDEVADEIEKMQTDIDARGADHRRARGNWSGRVWMWDFATNAYRRTVRLRF